MTQDLWGYLIRCCTRCYVYCLCVGMGVLWCVLACDQIVCFVCCVLVDLRNNRAAGFCFKSLG